MRLMKKKAGLILGGILLFSLVLVGVVMAVTQPTTATVIVKSFLSVTLSNTPVEFSNMNPNQTSNATVSTGFPLTATIGSESNVDANVQTRANTATFIGPTPLLAVGNMEWSTTSTFPGTPYTTSDASVCGVVTAGNSCDIYHQLTIPLAQTAGSYSVDITISAT